MKAVVPTAAGQFQEYRKRWLMLAIFVMCSCCNAMHWIQYSIISNVVTRYFNVNSSVINLTAVIFGICYIPFVFPASWLLSRYVSDARFKYLVGEWIQWVEGEDSWWRVCSVLAIHYSDQIPDEIQSHAVGGGGSGRGRKFGTPVHRSRRGDHCSVSLTEILISTQPPPNTLTFMNLASHI